MQRRKQLPGLGVNLEARAGPGIGCRLGPCAHHGRSAGGPVRSWTQTVGGEVSLSIPRLRSSALGNAGVVINNTCLRPRHPNDTLCIT